MSGRRTLTLDAVFIWEAMRQSVKARHIIPIALNAQVHYMLVNAGGEDDFRAVESLAAVAASDLGAGNEDLDERGRVEP